MRLLLDTHTLIWWLAGDPLLSGNAKAAVVDPDNEIFVSAASAWEITTKYRIGKLPQAASLAMDISGVLAAQGFFELPISMQH